MYQQLLLHFQTYRNPVISTFIMGTDGYGLYNGKHLELQLRKSARLLQIRKLHVPHADMLRRGFGSQAINQLCAFAREHRLAILAEHVPKEHVPFWNSSKIGFVPIPRTDHFRWQP